MNSTLSQPSFTINGGYTPWQADSTHLPINLEEPEPVTDERALSLINLT
jgi:hypothetical protein